MAEPIRCPDCGYSLADAKFHMDHRLCKNPGFFDDAMIVRNPAPHAAAPQGPSGKYREYTTGHAVDNNAELALAHSRLAAVEAVCAEWEQLPPGSYTGEAIMIRRDAAARIRRALGDGA